MLSKLANAPGERAHRAKRVDPDEPEREERNVDSA
jgi:hypothetical protein